MQDVNLIPAQRRAHKRKTARLSIWTAVCGVYLAALMFVLSLAYFAWGRDTGDVADKLQSTTQRIKEYHGTIKEMRQLLAQRRTELHTVRTIQQQPNWSKLLWLIGDALGEEIVLSQCRLTTLMDQQQDVVTQVKTAPTASTLSGYLTNHGYTLKLSGYSRSPSAVSLFVLRLERLGLFSSVRLEKSRRENFLDDVATAFSIECLV